MSHSDFYSAQEFHRKLRASADDALVKGGDIEWTVIAIGIAIVTSFLTSLVLVIQGVLPVLAAVPLNVLIIYSCQIVTHEASHNNVFNEKRFGAWPNNLIGFLLAIPLLWDFKTFQVIHLAHHKHTNDRMDDPQYRGNVVESWRNLYRAIVRYLPFAGAGDVKSGTSGVAGPKFSFNQPRSWYFFHGSLVVFLILAPKILLLVWVLPAFVATSLVVWMHTSLHTQAHGNEPGIAKSKLVVSDGLLGKLLNICFLYQNYHLIHHIMPSLPFHKTAQLSQRVLAGCPLKGIVHIDYSGGAHRDGEAVDHKVQS
ncbi:MAG: fatty acid desaturase [Alphaproteobacteria bacterium]|nr:fatty acid desaturase [Alphaproteobacteria bacterium]